MTDGRTIRILTVIHQFTRECVWPEADRSMNGPKVVAALNAGHHGTRCGATWHDAQQLCSEFAGLAVEALAIQNRRTALFYAAWKTVENEFIESFNGRLRDECLNVEWFTSLEEARRGLAFWRDHDNYQRPHGSLDDRSPAVFAALHGIGGALRPYHANKTSGKPRQGFASPAEAARDPARRLSEDTWV